MARKMKVSKQGKEFSGLKGWEKQYIKKSIAYGHLTPIDSKVTNKKRG